MSKTNKTVTISTRYNYQRGALRDALAEAGYDDVVRSETDDTALEVVAEYGGDELRRCVIGAAKHLGYHEVWIGDEHIRPVA